MTPKEKAEELHLSMCYAMKEEENEEGFYANTIHAERASLVAVNELLKLVTYQPTIDYWNEVINEIRNLNNK
jgi:hypothetical protein